MVCMCGYFCVVRTVVVTAGLRRKRKVPLCANRWELEFSFQIKLLQGESNTLIKSLQYGGRVHEQELLAWLGLMELFLQRKVFRDIKHSLPLLPV